MSEYKEHLYPHLPIDTGQQVTVATAPDAPGELGMRTDYRKLVKFKR